MTQETGSPESEIQALLERGRMIRQVPDAVRARAMARARASIVSAPRVAPMVMMPARRRRLRFALAASVVVAAGAAGAAAARRNQTPPEIMPVPPSIALAPAVVQPAVPAAADLVAEPAPPIRSAHVPRAIAAQESYGAEVGLLKRAQTAYVGRDCAGALALVGEHGRRFPNGRLAEEREALRVRSLAASGRTLEARRAAAIFAQRFPRSVLLPRLQETVDAAD